MLTWVWGRQGRWGLARSPPPSLSAPSPMVSLPPAALCSHHCVAREETGKLVASVGLPAWGPSVTSLVGDGAPPPPTWGHWLSRGILSSLSRLQVPSRCPQFGEVPALGVSSHDLWPPRSTPPTLHPNRGRVRLVDPGPPQEVLGRTPSKRRAVLLRELLRFTGSFLAFQPLGPPGVVDPVTIYPVPTP